MGAGRRANTIAFQPSPEVAALNPAVIIVTTIAGARAAQQATTTIPIVMASMNDPVGSGIIASLPDPAATPPALRPSTRTSLRS